MKEGAFLTFVPQAGELTSQRQKLARALQSHGQILALAFR
jgi:hypothetical protein